MLYILQKLSNEIKDVLKFNFIQTTNAQRKTKLKLKITKQIISLLFRENIIEIQLFWVYHYNVL